jgi:hypothetical protein
MTKNPYHLEYGTQSYLWLKHELEYLIQVNNDMNQGDLSEVDTAKTRGRISILKQLLNHTKAVAPK